MTSNVRLNGLASFACVYVLRDSKLETTSTVREASLIQTVSLADVGDEINSWARHDDTLRFLLRGHASSNEFVGESFVTSPYDIYGISTEIVILARHSVRPREV